MTITRIPYRYPGKTALHSQNAPRLRTIPISVSPLEIYVPPLHRAPQTKFHSIPVKSLCMILLFLRHGYIGLCSARKSLYRIGISLYMIYDSISSVFRACICKQSVINFCLNGQSCSRACLFLAVSPLLSMWHFFAAFLPNRFSKRCQKKRQAKP